MAGIDHAREIYQKSNFLLTNTWDFFFTDSRDIKFKVKSVNIPQKKLEAETFTTGEKLYTKYIPEDSFSITFLEDTQGETLKYFQDWKSEIINENNEFISMPTGVKKGDPGDKIHRQAVFLLYTPRFNNLQVTPVITKLVTPLRNDITKPVVSAYPVSISTAIKYREHPIYVIHFENIKFLNLSDLTFGYDSSSPLEYDVSFTADNIIARVQ